MNIASSIVYSRVCVLVPWYIDIVFSSEQWALELSQLYISFVFERSGLFRILIWGISAMKTSPASGGDPCYFHLPRLKSKGIAESRAGFTKQMSLSF